MALGKDFLHITQLDINTRLELARAVTHYLHREGEYTDLRAQLKAMGPYALPLVVLLAGTMTPRERVSLVECLLFGIHIDAPSARQLKAFDTTAYLGHRKSKVLPPD